MSSDNSGSTDINSGSIVAQQEQQQTQPETQSQDNENPQMLPQNRPSLSPLTLPQQPPASLENGPFAEIVMNRALYDPPRWGWTAVGGIADILSPHERSRRLSTCRAYKKRTRRIRKNGISGGGTKLGATTQLKDPPVYPITPSKEIPSSGPVFSEQNQSISSQPPLSLAALTSPSCSENPQQQPQNLDATESKSESKTTKGPSATIITKISASIEGSTGARDNSLSSRQEHERQDSVDTEGKNQNPNDNDQIGNRDTRTKEKTGERCTSSDKNVVMPKQQPKNDIGLEIVGISTNFLGMTIERQRQSTTESNNDSNDPEDDARNIEGNTNTTGRKSKRHGKNKSRRPGCGVLPRVKYDCHVQSLGISSLSSNSAPIGIEEKVDESNSKEILDMYTYHQGREGMEARDADTGELLFTQQVTDTNQDFDAPKSTFSIEIQFPLEDDDEVDDDDNECGTKDKTKNLECENRNHNKDKNLINRSGEDNNTIATAESTGRSSKKKCLAMYKEKLTWDLLDPNTPTPLAYAASIGKEYGLSFGQTFDLAIRIDKQIEKHVTETSHYREPIAVRGNMQEMTQARKIGPIRQPYRYDEIIQTKKEGGTFKPKRGCRGQTKPRSIAGTGVSKQRNGGSMVSETTKLGPKRSKTNKNGSATPSGAEISLEEELVEELLAEVKKRATAELDSDVGQNCKDIKYGILKAESNAICHICKKRTPIGYQFSCSMNNHVYCESHVSKRLGIRQESGVFRYNSCPICTLTCECARCIRKLKNVATIFKAKSIEQRKQLQEVDFPGILSACKYSIPSGDLNRAADLVLEKRQEEIRHRREEIKGQQQKKGEGECLGKTTVKKSRTILLAGQTMVPKPPLSDFPRELLNGSDFDARSTGAYFTVFSAEGQRHVYDVPDAWLGDDKRTGIGPESSQLTQIKNNSGIQEDGNVDYCHICKTAGHLILCDFCPRGFHQDCLRNNHNQSSPDGNLWECFVCKKEKTGSDNDFVDGKESIDIISGALMELDATHERAMVGLEVLSIIHQMLTNLVNYDFGYTFCKPVDTSLVPGYKDIVKRPMDIGTICSNLANGEFSELLNGNFSMDDLVTKVLNDVELIWRNCIMFNVIGSSVARMAVVLRRRVKMIYKRSIFCKLSDKVKKNVSNYAQKFDDAWASGMTVLLSKEKDDCVSTDTWKLSAIANLKPRSNLKFIAKTTNGRPIAIVDSVSGRVVKLYSSVKSASKAVEMILKLGHRCEWNASATRTDLNLKLIADKSRNDPNSLLFGYRWLFLDDLNEGKVSFLKSILGMIELRLDQFTFAFRSIEEALSSSHLSKTVDINDLRKKLMDLPRTGNWAEIDGVKWRRPLIPEQRRDSLQMKDSMMSAEEDLELDTDPVPDGDNLPAWKNCAFLKKDLVTDQNLVGFDSIQLAHQDWMQSAFSSPSFPTSEDRTMENFKKYYLDGDRNVDGMIWQASIESIKTQNEGGKEAGNKKNLADVMGIQDGGQNSMPESTNQGGNNMLSKTGESKSKSSVNESLSSSSSFKTIAMTDDQRQVALEHPSTLMTVEKSPIISRKRKFLDDKEIEFPSGQEARLSIVTVE